MVTAGGRAVRAVARSAWRKQPLRSEEEVERVRGICAVCPTLHKDGGLRLWCGEPMRLVDGVACGCLVNLKTRLSTEGCPQGKW